MRFFKYIFISSLFFSLISVADISNQQNIFANTNKPDDVSIEKWQSLENTYQKEFNKNKSKENNSQNAIKSALQNTKLIAQDGLSFGSSVALDPVLNFAVVGQPFNTNENGIKTGSAYVYSYDGSSWSHYQELLANDLVTGSDFGDEVEIDGDWIAVTSPVFSGALESTEN